MYGSLLAKEFRRDAGTRKMEPSDAYSSRIEHGDKCQKIRADDEMLRERDMELASEVREKLARATVKPAF